MKKLLNLFILIYISFVLVGCSSFSDKFNIASVIDSKESWIFGEKNNKSDEELKEINKESTNGETNKTNIETLIKKDKILEKKVTFIKSGILKIDKNIL